MAKLDDDLCVRLEDSLLAFNAALNEEQVWSLAFQSLLLLKQRQQIQPQDCLFSTKYLFLSSRDGSVHPKSLSFDHENRQKAQNRNQLFASLGVLLFKALDFGLEEDEERSLSRPLELLIESLTSCDPNLDSDSKDEGIEHDYSLDDVIQKCVSRLSSRESADTHYRAVVRALVAETLELSLFLEQVSREKETKAESRELSDLKPELEFHDWARLWIQVIRQLRQGVQLRHVDHKSLPPSLEYELTPFEMLLDDIRFRRYKLNHVTEEECCRKDAHQLILDFIRSRPPLLPVSQRQLKPLPQKRESLYEKLMTSIRERDHVLRPTPLSSSASNLNESQPMNEVKETLTPGPQRRRLIKPDLNLRLSLSCSEDEEEEEEDKKESQEKRKFSLKNLSLRLLERRHSMPVQESPDETIDANEDTRQHVANIWQSVEWGRALQCLSLTLEEVQHIRSVLTKAELETLAVTRELRHDLESGRICFTCLKTRFSFFGARPHVCKVCERAICERCATRMHIPLETFAKVPIYMLSPTPSPEEKSFVHQKEKRAQMEPKKKSFNFSKDIVVDSGLRKSGPLVRVCRDCKTLVRHLIDIGSSHYKT